MYKVDISPAANSVLEEYAFRCVNDNGTECALHFIIDQITKMRKNNLVKVANEIQALIKYRFMH